MSDDPRTGYPESGTVQIAAADGSTPQTGLDIPANALFRPTAVKVEYDGAGTVNTTITLYDDADGTSAANVTDRRERFLNVAPGDRIAVDELDMRDIENDVLVQADGNQDAALDVTVYGELITGLSDLH